MKNSGFLIVDDYSFLTASTLYDVDVSNRRVRFKFEHGQVIDVSTAFEHFSTATGETTTFRVGDRGQKIDRTRSANASAY